MYSTHGGHLAILFLKPFISTISFAPSRTTIPIMRQKAILQRAKWRGCGQGWGNMDRAFKTGSRNKKKFKCKKQSTVLATDLGSLNTQNTYYPGSISITQASILSLIWIPILVFYLLIISLLCSLNANNISTRLTTLSSLCEQVEMNMSLYKSLR